MVPVKFKLKKGIFLIRAASAMGVKLKIKRISEWTPLNFNKGGDDLII